MINVLDRPTIVLTPIEINYSDKVDDDKDIQYNSEQYGKYPYVYISGATIESKDIKFLKISNDTMYPTLEMEFTDPTSTLIDDKYPIDGEVISIFIKASSDILMPIRMDFLIVEFHTLKESDSSDTLTFKLEGILNVEDLYIIKSESFNETSFNVIRNLSKKMKLGFASNVQKTNDSMVWINGSNYRYNFLREMITHSYISDATFLFGYVDFYYNFNYVDIETALQEDISDQVNVTNSQEVVKDGKETTTPLILTNHPDRNSTNMYISKYIIDNQTTQVNLEKGYIQMDSQYDKTMDKYDDFVLDTISDSGTDGRIIMKGSKENNYLYNNLIKSTWMGKLDEDNVHENYLYAGLQNTNNLKFLQKLKMVIKMKNPNYNLYRFQKVLVELYNLGKLETNEDTSGEKETKDIGDDQYDNKIINKLSGEWLITGINFSFSRTEGNFQEITMVKRELTSKYIFKRKQKKTN